MTRLNWEQARRNDKVRGEVTRWQPPKRQSRKRGPRPLSRRDGYAICPSCKCRIRLGEQVVEAPGLGGVLRHTSCRDGAMT